MLFVSAANNFKPDFAAPLCAVDDIHLENRDGCLRLTAKKHVGEDEPYLHGHFPGFKIVPGVFLLEMLRQAVTIALRDESPLAGISAIRSMRFLAPVFPGDRVTLNASIEPIAGTGEYRVEACCDRSDGVSAARFKMEFRDGA